MIFSLFRNGHRKNKSGEVGSFVCRRQKAMTTRSPRFPFFISILSIRTINFFGFMTHSKRNYSGAFIGILLCERANERNGVFTCRDVPLRKSFFFEPENFLNFFKKNFYNEKLRRLRMIS